MGVGFYLSDSRFWSDECHLGMPWRDFEILQNLLGLDSQSGDTTGTIAVDTLLLKIEQGVAELRRVGKEWERSATPPPEGQEGHSLIVLGTPGLDQYELFDLLYTLYDIACKARDIGCGVKWS